MEGGVSRARNHEVSCTVSSIYKEEGLGSLETDGKCTAEMKHNAPDADAEIKTHTPPPLWWEPMTIKGSLFLSRE